MKLFAGVLILAAALTPYRVKSEPDSTDVVDSEPVTTQITTIRPAGPDCNCPRVYQPVCGTNAQTASNACVLRCISNERQRLGLSPIYVKAIGECPRPPCNCNNRIQTLCGTDGENYGNDCLFTCENNIRNRIGLPPIGISNRGPCPNPTCICSDIIIPVCGTDGRTYRNVCILQCVSRANQNAGGKEIGIAHAGACAKESCNCPPDNRPVCATDGNTYPNLCVLRCVNRRRDQLGLPPLSVQYNGRCTDCICPAVYDPVCASNGVTYANTCTLGCENRKRALQHLPPLTIKSRGVCPCICPLIYAPVCASDERTYGNLCQLNCENKRRRDLGYSQLYVVNQGRCVCNCRYCPNIYAPVCGNDGRTYYNKCYLDCNRACNSDIGRILYVVYYGPC